MTGISIAASLVVGAVGVNANESIVKAQSNSDQWAVTGHDYGNTRFSPLKQINSENVGKLSLAYSFSLGSLRSNESSPIVIGNTLYVSHLMGPEIRLCARCRDRRAQMDL